MGLVFIMLAIKNIGEKENLCEDELFSYGSSNYVGYPLMEVENGVAYGKGSTPYEEYLYAHEGELFNYPNVWRNQGIDVHPPLYYVLVHTVCSLFPETFSIWYAGIINIVFSLITLFVIYLTAVRMSGSRFAACAVCAVFCTIAGIQVANTYFRMYIMAMCWVMCISYIHVNGMYAQKLSRNFYISLGAVSVLAALTHYYCVVFLVFQCIYFGIYMLAKKRYRETLYYAGTMFSAAALSILCFPKMLEQVFSGYRGKESFENFKNVEGYPEALGTMWGYINRELFGGKILYYLIIVAAGLLLLTAWKKFKGIPGLGLLLVPCILYYLLITRIAIYKIGRYLYPVYAVLLLAACLLLIHIVTGLVKGLPGKAAAGLLLCIIVAGSYKLCYWEYSFKNDAERNALEAAKRYAGYDCIYIYRQGGMWACAQSYYEVKNYGTLTFVDEEDMTALADRGEDGLVVYVLSYCDLDKVLREVLKMCPKLERYEQISEMTYTKAFYFE